MAHEQPMPIEDDSLLEGFLALETPEGFHAELVEGEIVVTPPPVGAHEANFSRLVRQVLRHSATEMDVAGNKGLALPGDGRRLRNHVIPDATFAPCDLALFDDAPSWMAPDGVALVAEITGSRPELDRGAKRRGYALGGIPLYLLIDREEQTVTLHSEPARRDYEAVFSFTYGKPVPLPPPFAFDLDTSHLL
ncbi:Uma2 family endonuclease [Streptomyces sp. 3MP-14]|uniref:Uma2 family endonuclease n=2 Tax=Streptomyces TaxID=1883 RepID=A0A5N6A1A5_9ACTN|nr:Uma2 family endonuclease [Streptomyces mimosae]KAB8174953.1 Uma2 family endonuclease [Streptomyces sp. 3MP-14]